MSVCFRPAETTPQQFLPGARDERSFPKGGISDPARAVEESGGFEMTTHHYRRPGGRQFPKRLAFKGGLGVKLAAILLCLSVLAGFLPAPAPEGEAFGPVVDSGVPRRCIDSGSPPEEAEGEEAGAAKFEGASRRGIDSDSLPKEAAAGTEKFSAIAKFDSITLHRVDANDEPEAEAVADHTLLEKGERLVLRYNYRLTGEQCQKVLADTPYYLEVSPHLALPPDLKTPLTTTDTGEQFGTLHADGNDAWVTFLPNAGGSGTILSDYVDGEDFEGAYFYLTCNRADNIPTGETPIDGNSNLYAMGFETTPPSYLRFGYAENEPVNAQAQINKNGEYKDKTITWTIEYTPWQNPAPNDPVALDTPFELRDTVDASCHSYVPGSAEIDGVSIAEYSSRDQIPQNAETYLLAGSLPDSPGTLIFGGTKFNAGEATRGDQAKALKITYRTSVNTDLLLPGGTGGKAVSNAAELFAGPGFENHLGISGKAEVTVDRLTWLTKTGKTTRDPGNGSTTNWDVVFDPNGFTFEEGNRLTLHDQLPKGSEPVEGSLKVNGTQKHVEVGADNSFTVFPIVPAGTEAVHITYQTYVPEDMYNSGTSLGSNIAYFTFDYGGKGYTTPQVKTPIGSGDGSGDPGTSPLVKENKGYDAAARTINWEVTINHHQAYLKSGTFTDDLGAVGPAACGNPDHGHGLELVDGAADVKVKVNETDPTEDEKKLIDLKYEGQVLTITVGDIGLKAITLTYTTKVSDPCVFANNIKTAKFKNTVSTTDMMIGTGAVEGRSAGADSTADVSATVLTKKAPVYNYETGRMTWAVEVNAAGLSMADVVLTDDLPAGLTYVKGSLATNPEIADASASVNGQTLAIALGAVTQKTTVTFETEVDPKVLGFDGDKPVVVNNTINMDGSADGVTFATVSHSVQQSFLNHGLVKKSTVDNKKELIRYEVLINPYRLSLSEKPSLVDTLDKRLQLDTDTLMFYKANVKGTTTGSSIPGYEKVGDGQKLEVTGFDPASNSFTVQLPVSAGDTGAYVLTYTADITKRQAGGYSNSVRFEGEDLLLGGNKSNSATVSAGGSGGGGGGVAARKATISVAKTAKDTGKPLPGATFTLYQWNGAERGLAVKQEVTDKDGKLSFLVKPNKQYLLVESEGAPGYGSTIGGENLPAGVTVEPDSGGLLFTAGAAKTKLELSLTNEPLPDTDLKFRLVNEGGIPIAGAEVQLFETNADGTQSSVPHSKATVAPDGTVSFSGVRRGAKYVIRLPDGKSMTVYLPPKDGEKPQIMLPDGGTETLTADYKVTGVTQPADQWTLTVNQAAGATVGLYADENCTVLIQQAVSDQNGSVTFSKLIKGQKYWIKEIKPPPGYLPNTQVYEAGEGIPPITIPSTPDPTGGSDGSGGSDNSDGSGGSGGSDNSDGSDWSDWSDWPDWPGGSGGSGKPGAAAGTPAGGNAGAPGKGPGAPQTGDNTWILETGTLLSGILLAAMTLYRLWGSRKHEKKYKYQRK